MATPDDGDDLFAETSDPAELKNLRADLAEAKRQLKRLEKEFLDRLKIEVTELNNDSEVTLVLRILKSDLQDRLDADIESGRRSLADRYRTWADKYAVTLLDLESQRIAAATNLNGYFKDLGYE